MTFSTRFLPHLSAGLLLCLLGSAALVQPALAQSKKKPLPQPGRLHLANGRTQPAQLRLDDCDLLKSVGPDGMEQTYSPDDVSSFVMGTDSFTVLRDFYVTLVRDAEHYNSSFVRVCAAGAGLELYEFRGSMTRNQHSTGSGIGVVAASSALRAVTGVTPIVGSVGQGEKVVMTTAWLLRRDGNPRWLTLPSGARNLREVIEPIVADDKELVVRWPIRPQDTPLLLSQYVAHKTSPAKP